MKWTSHADVSRSIAEALCLRDDIGELLVEASLDPDQNALRMSSRSNGGARRARIRHHSPPRGELMRLLWRARRSWLVGEEEDAVWRLGRALHYVEDMHVATGAFMLGHDRAEDAIAGLAVRRDAVAVGIGSAIPSPRFVRRCLEKAGPRKSPRQALDSATMLSSAIAGAVLSAERPSPVSAALWRASRRRHRFIMMPLAVGAPAALIVISFGSGHAPFSVLAIPLLIAVLAADHRYRFDRDEARWFGIGI